MCDRLGLVCRKVSASRRTSDSTSCSYVCFNHFVASICAYEHCSWFRVHVYYQYHHDAYGRSHTGSKFVSNCLCMYSMRRGHYFLDLTSRQVNFMRASLAANSNLGTGQGHLEHRLWMDLHDIGSDLCAYASFGVLGDQSWSHLPRASTKEPRCFSGVCLISFSTT